VSDVRVSDERWAAICEWLDTGNMLEGMPDITDGMLDELAWALRDARAELARLRGERQAIHEALIAALPPGMTWAGNEVSAISALGAEVGRLRPVVEAARRWRWVTMSSDALIAAIDAADAGRP
jgi:hypothetical protein